MKSMIVLIECYDCRWNMTVNILRLCYSKKSDGELNNISVYDFDDGKEGTYRLFLYKNHFQLFFFVFTLNPVYSTVGK